MYSTGKDDGPTMGEYIKEMKYLWERNWKLGLYMGLKYDVAIWWDLLNLNMIRGLSNKHMRKYF